MEIACPTEEQPRPPACAKHSRSNSTNSRRSPGSNPGYIRRETADRVAQVPEAEDSLDPGLLNAKGIAESFPLDTFNVQPSSSVFVPHVKHATSPPLMTSASQRGWIRLIHFPVRVAVLPAQTHAVASNCGCRVCLGALGFGFKA